jgi:predicted metal-dependent hydrolase
MMKVRYPEFDFSQTSVHWCKNPEQSQVINAGNIIPTYIEPFLIKVMRKAKNEQGQARAVVREFPADPVPRYDPKNTPAPKNLDAVLAQYS